jgi:hypothetical protein
MDSPLIANTNLCLAVSLSCCRCVFRTHCALLRLYVCVGVGARVCVCVWVRLGMCGYVWVHGGCLGKPHPLCVVCVVFPSFCSAVTPVPCFPVAHTGALEVCLDVVVFRCVWRVLLCAPV